MLAASKEDIVDIIRSTARFGEAYALRKYDAIIAAAQDAAVFGRALPSNAVRIRLYIDTYQEYQKHLDALLKTLHETVEKLQDTLIYDQICLLQSLRGIGFLSAVVLIAEMRAMESQIKAFDKAIAEQMALIPNTLTSVNGIGPVYSAGIIAEIGDINRFPNQASLAKYAGLVWSQHQSGDFEAQNTRMIQSGNRYLKYYTPKDWVFIPSDMPAEYKDYGYWTVPYFQQKASAIGPSTRL